MTPVSLAMKTNLKLTYSLLLSLLLMTSCHPGVIIDLFNNSRHELVVTTINQRSEETTCKVKQNRVVRIGIAAKVRVDSPSGSWHYEFVVAPEEFWRRHNSMVSVINVQIEKDGKIYVLSPDTREVVTNFPPQPSGFPLVPK
jgi:hypothetical protein